MGWLSRLSCTELPISKSYKTIIVWLYTVPTIINWHTLLRQAPVMCGIQLVFADEGWLQNYEKQTFSAKRVLINFFQFELWQLCAANHVAKQNTLTVCILRFACSSKPLATTKYKVNCHINVKSLILSQPGIVQWANHFGLLETNTVAKGL